MPYFKDDHGGHSPARGGKAHDASDVWAMLSGLAGLPHAPSAAAHDDKPSRGPRTVKPRKEKQESPELEKLLEASAQILATSTETNALLRELIKKLTPPVHSR